MYVYDACTAMCVNVYMCILHTDIHSHAVERASQVSDFPIRLSSYLALSTCLSLCTYICIHIHKDIRHP